MTKMPPDEFFTGKQLYNRYLYAIQLAKELIWYIDNGYIVFHGEKILEGTIHINETFNDEVWDVISIKYPPENNSTLTVGLIHIEYYENGRPWIPTKREIKETFKEFTVVHPKHIKSIF